MMMNGFKEIFCLSPPRSPKGNVLGLWMDGEVAPEDSEMESDDDQDLQSRNKLIPHLGAQEHLDPISAYTTLTDNQGPNESSKTALSPLVRVRALMEVDAGGSDGSMEEVDEGSESDGGRWTSPEDHERLVAVC